MKETHINQAEIINLPSVQSRAATSTLAIISSLSLLMSALLLWILSLRSVDLSKMNDLGLASVLPLTFFAALGVLTINYMAVLSRNSRYQFLLLLHVIALIFMLHGTPQILYGTLRYSWAWKHVGVVDFIQRHGSVQPTITTLNAYQNWPGFFSLAAFFNTIAGIKSSAGYAGWGPVFFNLLDLGALLLAFNALTKDKRLVWLGVWFFFLSSWVGQDYFSPQAMAYFFYIVVLACVLIWFSNRRVVSLTGVKNTIQNSRLSRLYQSITSSTTPPSVLSYQATPIQRLAIMGILITVFLAIASSHQLTPLMLLSALSALVIFNVTSQRYLPVMLAVITVGWIVFMAVGFLEANLYTMINSFGLFTKNVNANLLNLANVSRSQQFIAYMDRFLSGSIWLLGILGIIRRIRAKQWDLPAILLLLSPIALLAANAYGGEMLFRVYLFSLPFVAFFAASLLYPKWQSGNSIGTPVFSVLISAGLLAGFIFSYYGKDEMYYFTKNEIAAANYLYTNAPKGSLLVDGTTNWPRQSFNYEYYNYFTISRLTKTDRLNIIKNPVNTLTYLMDDAAQGSVYINGNPNPTVKKPGNDPENPASDKDDYPAAYFIITRSQIAETEMTGVLPADALTNIATALVNSGRYQVVYSNQDAVIMKFIK